VLFASPLLLAQSITVTPKTAYVQTGATSQFSATVSGLSSSGVTWSAGGRVGGNSTAGTISSTGLYTAPAKLPGQNPVQIVATSMADGKTKGIAYVDILSAGPTITSVSPNPLPVGTFTVTVTGSGFLPGAEVYDSFGKYSGIQLVTLSVTSTTVTATGYQGPAASASFNVKNPGSVAGNSISVPVAGSSGGSGSSSGGGSGSGAGSGSGGGSTPAPTVSPSSATVALGGTQSFTGTKVTSWSASAGTITAAGLYTAPATMPTSSSVTITATGAGGSATATVTLISNVAPVIQTVSPSTIPLGVFSITMVGTGFGNTSVVTFNGSPLGTTLTNATTLTATGFAGAPGSATVTVNNGSVASQPVVLPIGIQNPQVSINAARHFLQQAAFGPKASDVLSVQQLGFQAWLAQQYGQPKTSTYADITSSQGGLPARFLTDAVNQPDQLRQRVAFALSQILVTSINTLIWNQTVAPYQEMLMTDAFGNFRQILQDVTLSPAMGEYLNAANNAKGNANNTVLPNENYAREVLQLFSIGTDWLNTDGTPQLDSSGNRIPTYTQATIGQFAEVFTGWTYAPTTAGGQPNWGAYINPAAPMVAMDAYHDQTSKTLLNYPAPSGVLNVLPANQSTVTDLQQGLDNIFNHPNVGPFISQQLIQHLVKSNPSPQYVARVATAFNNDGTGVRGNMQAVISAILLDQEARQNDVPEATQPSDGHMQEPILFLAGFLRAFGAYVDDTNYFPYDLTNMGQDIYNPPSVFNYYSPGYVVPGYSLLGPEFQIYTPNSAVYRDNVVSELFSSWSNNVQSYGAGTTVDLTPFVALAGTPSTLVDALDFTLTNGTAPAGLKQILVNAIAAETGGSLRQAQTAIYLMLMSGYYNVWN
jgi:uncharacterized protein (DUF1800 family)